MEKENVQSNIFRKKSIDRISSPEQLNDYLRVSTPSIWIILAAVIVLLIGVCTWAITGNLDTTVSAAAMSENGIVTVYIHEDSVQQVQAGQTVRCDGEEGILTAISAMPVQVDDSFDRYLCHTGGLQAGEWVYTGTLELDCEEGVQLVSIVTESVSPMSFLLN